MQPRCDLRGVCFFQLQANLLYAASTNPKNATKYQIILILSRLLSQEFFLIPLKI